MRTQGVLKATTGDLEGVGKNKSCLWDECWNRFCSGELHRWGTGRNILYKEVRGKDVLLRRRRLVQRKEETHTEEEGREA